MATKKNRVDLKTQSDVIKNETTALANTKNRVALMVEDVNESSVNWLDDVEVDLSSNSDSKVPTVKAVVDGANQAEQNAKDYADNLALGIWKDVGTYTVNDAGNIDYPSSGGSGPGGAILTGNIWTLKNVTEGVSTINNLPVEYNGTVRALVDNPSPTNDADWAIGDSIDTVPTLQKTIDAGNTWKSEDDGRIEFYNSLNNYIGSILNIGNERIAYEAKESNGVFSAHFSPFQILFESVLGISTFRFKEQSTGMLADNYNTYNGTDFGGLGGDPPPATYDSSLGYIANRSRLRNVVTQIEYLCTHDTPTAAVWVAHPRFVQFRKKITSAEIYSGGNYDIDELPSIIDKAWALESCYGRIINSTIGYDVLDAVRIFADGTSKEQFRSSNSFLGEVGTFQPFDHRTSGTTSGPNIAIGEKIIVTIPGGSTQGDGTLIIYGTAILITPE